MLKKLFGFDPSKTTVRTEIIAGITTFLTMSYILAINPAIFSEISMPAGAVFTSTALAAIVGTLVMAFWAKLPFGLAPSVGLQNAGVIIDNGSTLVDLGDITSGSPLLAFIGLLITGFLYIKNVRGEMLIGMIAYVLINLVCGNFKKLTTTMYILATLFILKYIFI